MDKRFGKSKGQEKSPARVAMAIAQDNESSVTSTQEDFAKNMTFLPTSPESWAGREDPLSTKKPEAYQGKMGEFF